MFIAGVVLFVIIFVAMGVWKFFTRTPKDNTIYYGNQWTNHD